MRGHFRNFGVVNKQHFQKDEMRGRFRDSGVAI